MSNLLEQASLVMIPSGYKEDVVYSEIPLDGSGDLSFTRASNGTRVNFDGLVEVVPWNLVTYSNDFLNAAWLKSNINLTSGQTDKDGGTNAWKVDFAGSANSAYMFQELPAGQKTGAVWVKGTAGQTAYIGIRSSVASGALFTFNGSWQQVVETSTDLYFIFSNYGAGTATTFLMQYVQANIGSTAKPYFPTTDRLNVPRLTYQNGGGGCPSLLLEKQSTNNALYSEDFTNTVWTKADVTISSNVVNSPDGTQNADLIYPNSSGNFKYIYQAFSLSSNIYTLSVFAKAQNKNVIWLYIQDSSGYGLIYFDLSDGTMSTTAGGTSTPTGTMTAMGNGWYRCTFTLGSSIALSAGSGFGVCDAKGSPYATASGTNGIYIWGAQME
jgi:hypothetical protein